MYVQFQDSGEIITKVRKEKVRFDGKMGRFISIFSSLNLKEDEDVYIFTEDNLDEYTKHYNDKIISAQKRHIENLEISLELMENYKSDIKKLEDENYQLKKVNKQLCKTITELKYKNKE